MKLNLFSLTLIFLLLNYANAESLSLDSGVYNSIGNLAKYDFNINAINGTTIDFCYLLSEHTLEENQYYWYKEFNANNFNVTVIVDKNNNHITKLYCKNNFGISFLSNPIYSDGYGSMPVVVIFLLLLISFGMLIIYNDNGNIIYLTVSAGLFFLFVKLSEAYFLNEVEYFTEILAITKIFMAILLVGLLYDKMIKKSMGGMQ